MIYLIENPHVIAENLSYIMLVWFLFILATNVKEQRYSSLILSVYWFSYCFIFYNGLFDQFEYLEVTELIINIDGAFALIMSLVFMLDKKSVRLACILIFAVLCHVVLIYHLTISSSFITKAFYIWYDELIITAAILQLWVSRDGMAKGLDNVFRFLQGVLFRGIFHSYRIHKSLFTQKKAKANP